MKLCTRCNRDCSDRPRVKDPQGRYICRDCLNPEELRAASAAGSASPSPPSRRLAPTAPSTPPADDPIPIVEDDPLPTLEVCPACQKRLAPGSALCIACGYDIRRGKRISTNLGGEPNLPELPPARSRCPKCGYDLRGQKTPRCPECGTLVLAKDIKERMRASSADAARTAYIRPLVFIAVGLTVAIVSRSAQLETSELIEYIVGLRHQRAHRGAGVLHLLRDVAGV